jgi:heme/copper-type cytochrome/quinol oxidase subunit 2
MHSHGGTMRLLVKIVSLVLVGLALYFILFYGINGFDTSHTQGVATSTASASRSPALATTTVPTIIVATSSVISSSSTSNKPTPTSPDPSKEVIVTNADNNQTVTIYNGKPFEVDFGGDLNWVITFDPSDLITQNSNNNLSAGVQGMYTANGTGTVILKANGAPICKAGQACPMFRVVSTITLIIQ